MKIVITVSQITPGGGLTKYVCSLADILTRKGKNTVWILTTHSTEANPEIESLIKTRDLKCLALGHLSRLKKYFSLFLILRKIAPDLIINNYNAPTQYILPFLLKKIKVVHILHNNTADFYRVAAINGRYVDRWVAPTPALAVYFNEYTHQKYKSRITIIPHGVSDPVYAPSKTTTTPQLTFVGVLYEHKGVKILPDIIKSLITNGYKFHFTFIGDGILRQELEERLSCEIKDSIVEFTGRISGNEVYRRLSQTDIFVYPTHIDAFGLVIAEAMINHAIPVVTLLPGITDSIIDNGVNGYLVEKDQIEDFVRQISILLENEPLRQDMGNAAFNKAMSSFSIEVMEKNYIVFINSLF